MRGAERGPQCSLEKIARGKLTEWGTVVSAEYMYHFLSLCLGQLGLSLGVTFI